MTKGHLFKGALFYGSEKINKKNVTFNNDYLLSNHTNLSPYLLSHISFHN